MVLNWLQINFSFPNNFARVPGQMLQALHLRLNWELEHNQPCVNIRFSNEDFSSKYVGIWEKYATFFIQDD